MTWVLVLRPNGNDRWPAVIGGYATKDAAEHAGKYATSAMYRMQQNGTWEAWCMDHPHGGIIEDGVRNDWAGFIVVPGAAAMSSVSENKDHA
jgi:hypothetical protein